MDEDELIQSFEKEAKEDEHYSQQDNSLSGEHKQLHLDVVDPKLPENHQHYLDQAYEYD